MTDSPLVSGVIIFLNAEPFLEEAIESVFAQTSRNWELMLVDDGSSDGSTAIARQYAAAHPDRVHYLEHPGHANRGMSASRNLGSSRGRGEYIAFLDADDVWMPRKLEEQCAILQAHPSADMVYGRSQYWFSWSKDARQEDETHELGIPADTLVAPPTLQRLFLQGRVQTPCPTDIMVRRSAWERVGGFEDAFRGLYEDQAFLAKIYVSGSVFVSGECWSRHRRHPDSFMAVTRRTVSKHPPGLAYLKWLEKYLAGQGVRDEELWVALRKKQWRYRHPVWHRAWTRSLRPFTRVAGALKRAALRAGRRPGHGSPETESPRR